MNKNKLVYSLQTLSDQGINFNPVVMHSANSLVLKHILINFQRLYPNLDKEATRSKLLGLFGTFQHMHHFQICECDPIERARYNLPNTCWMVEVKLLGWFWSNRCIIYFNE